jgi:hypothetical protein
LASLEKKVLEINPLALIKKTIKSEYVTTVSVSYQERVPLIELLDIHAFDKEQILKVDPLLASVQITDCSHKEHEPHTEECHAGSHH